MKWHNFKAIFAVILRTFDLKSYGQTSVKIVFVMFGLVFMKFKKFKCLHQEKNLISIKLRYFHYLSNSLLCEVKTIFKLLFPIFDWRHQIGIEKSCASIIPSPWQPAQIELNFDFNSFDVTCNYVTILFCNPCKHQKTFCFQIF